MSNMPLIPPILPLVNDDANAPEPESENAEALKARREQKLLDEDSLLDPKDREGGLFGTRDDNEVDVEIAAAKRREGKA